MTCCGLLGFLRQGSEAALKGHLELRRSIERRHWPHRRKTHVEAHVETAGGRLQVVIKNVSFEGMNLSLPHNLSRGTLITVCFFGERLSAVVEWSRARQAGVQLVERLSGQTLIALERAQDA